MYNRFNFLHDIHNKHFKGWDIDGAVQERCNSSANALELHLSCSNPLIWSVYYDCYLILIIINSCGHCYERTQQYVLFLLAHSLVICAIGGTILWFPISVICFLKTSIYYPVPFISVQCGIIDLFCWKVSHAAISLFYFASSFISCP